MKKIILLVILFWLLKPTFSQTATYKDVVDNKKGKFTEYVSSDDQKFSVGDTITLGIPFRNEAFVFIFQIDPLGMQTYPLDANSSNSKVVIKKIQIQMKQLSVNTTKPASAGLALRIINFEEAIKQGEIKSNFLSTDEALKKLNTEKNKLDLGLITQEEYNKKKEELSKYIK